MWIKRAKQQQQKISVSWTMISAEFQRAVANLGNLLSIRQRFRSTDEIPFLTGNATSIPFESNSFDAVVGSPPYATRLDYIRGTMPELAVLGADEPTLEELRRITTGSPVVKNAANSKIVDIRSEKGAQLLDQMRRHQSKGSRNNYFPWMRNYLGSLQQCFVEIDRTVRPRGEICVVVQDSRYKQIHVDLQNIVTEMFECLGRPLYFRSDHSALNPRLHRRMKPIVGMSGPNNTETLLVFS